MKRKQSRKAISCLLAAVSIFVTITASGCTTHRRHLDNGEHRMTRTVNPAVLAGVTVGLLVLGTAAWLYSRSDTQQTKEQPAHGQVAQTQEPEKSQNQK